jgi:hypothetical protein
MAMQYLGYSTRGQVFAQGQINTVTEISKVVITPILKEVQPYRFFNPTWLPFKKRARCYEVDCQVWVNNPTRYVSNCITSRLVSGDSKEMCTIYIYPIFASTSEENYNCTFSINFEVTETSITQYKFVLLDPQRDEPWESEVIQKFPVESLV